MSCVAGNPPGFITVNYSTLSCAVRSHDKRIACEEEFSDSEDEGEGGRRNTASFKKAKHAKTEGEKEGEEKEKKGEEESKGIPSFILHFHCHLIYFIHVGSHLL